MKKWEKTNIFNKTKKHKQTTSKCVIYIECEYDKMSSMLCCMCRMPVCMNGTCILCQFLFWFYLQIVWIRMAAIYTKKKCVGLGLYTRLYSLLRFFLFFPNSKLKNTHALEWAMGSIFDMCPYNTQMYRYLHMFTVKGHSRKMTLNKILENNIYSRSKHRYSVGVSSIEWQRRNAELKKKNERKIAFNTYDTLWNAHIIAWCCWCWLIRAACVSYNGQLLYASNATFAETAQLNPISADRLIGRYHKIVSFTCQKQRNKQKIRVS